MVNQEVCPVEVFDQDRISASTANQVVIWHFNLLLAPHFGGIHETVVKAAQQAVYAILGNTDITDEELSTVFTEAEALLN